MNAEEVMSLVTDLVTQWGLKVVGAIVVLVVGRMVAGALRGGVRKALTKREVDATLVPFLSSLVYFATLAFVVIAVLSLFGIQTTSLVAILGAAGLAVGLALQGTLSHFASGVMLLIFRPFRVGDVVEVGGTVGKVEEIGIFTTTLKSPDNIKITVPNSQIYGDTIRNYNGYDIRRVDMVMGISYDDDIGRAIETMDQVIRQDSRVLSEPQPQIAVSELADSSVNLVVRPWCKSEDYFAVKFDLTRRFKEELEAAGCSIPYPQHDVHLVQQQASG
ncbi:MAG: mechanosensitive ion channel [Acidobacteriota bacterium]